MDFSSADSSATPSAPTLRCYSKPGESTDPKGSRSRSREHKNLRSLQNSLIEFHQKTQQNTIQWYPMLHFFRSIQDLWSFDPRILSQASHWSAPSAPAEPRSLPYVVGVGTPGTPICHFKRFKAYTVYRNRFCSSLHINIILQNWLLMLQKATSPAHSTQYMVQAFPVRLNLLISNKWLKIPYFQLNYGKFM